MNILALDCSGETCSVAISIDGQVQQRIETAASQQHSRILLPMLTSLLGEAGLEYSDLNCIACGTGPGSFTGVRVATAICQGLGYGSGVPTLGVSTLAALAWGSCQLHGADEALVAIDARMEEIYLGHYKVNESGLVALRADSVCSPGSVTGIRPNNCIAVGNGWSRYANELASLSACCDDIDAGYPLQAADIASLSAMLISTREASPGSAESLQPVYLRNQVTG